MSLLSALDNLIDFVEDTDGCWRGLQLKNSRQLINRVFDLRHEYYKETQERIEKQAEAPNTPDTMESLITDLVDFVEDASGCWNGWKRFQDTRVAHDLGDIILAIRHKHKQKSKATPKKETTYYVFNPGNNTPAIAHSTYESARKESMRLATKNPNKKFLVLQALESSEAIVTTCMNTFVY